LGFSDGVRLPALVIFVGVLGFGSLCRETGLSLEFTIANLVTMWALPGQIAFVELFSAGNSIAAIVIAVAMANARFLPMTATLAPLVRPGMRDSRWLYVMVHLVSFNLWIWLLRRLPELSPAARVRYYLGFATSTFTAGVIGAVLGYFLAGVVPHVVTLGFVFLFVGYFALILADVRGVAGLGAVILGALLGPALHLVSSDWGILLTGVAGGTIAYLAERGRRGWRA